MGLSLVLGKSGTGKTDYLYNQVIDYANHNPEQKLIVMVPEQFTLQTQEDLIKKHPSHGIMSIEVLSFQRLAFRFKEQLLQGNKAQLTDVGKHMLIKKILLDKKNVFNLIHHQGSKPGYIEELKGLITEFYQYRLDTEQFTKILENNQLDNRPLLKGKLEDLNQLFQLYQEQVESDYINPESMLEQLIPIIQKQELIKDAIVVIDGFYGFTPVQYSLIQEISVVAKELYISVTIDPKQEDNLLYHESKLVINQLFKICEKNHISVRTPIVQDVYGNQDSFRYTNDALRHLRDNLYQYPYTVYDQPSKHLYICEASTMTEEVAYLADSIMDLIIHRGMRYKDIVVMTGDINTYQYLIRDTFSKYEIPFFIDQKSHLLKHPVVEMLLSGIRIIHNRFRYQDVFGFLKSGFTNLSDDEIANLENYVLTFDIKGKKNWQSKWEKVSPALRGLEDQFITEVMNRLNESRDAFIKAIMPLNDLLSSTISDQVVVLYQWMDQLKVEEQLFKISISLEKEERFALAQDYHQIFPLIMSVFEQISDIYPDEKISLEALLSLLESAFEVSEIGIIPATIDQVMIGSIDRSRFNVPNALFVIGMSEGILPKHSNKAGVITDQERQLLLSMNMPMASDNRQYSYQEQFNTYMGLIRAKSHLYFSYPSIGFDGKSLKKSTLIHMISKLYKHLKPIYIGDITANRLIINRLQPTFERVVIQGAEGNFLYKEGFLETYEWFRKDPKWQALLEQLMASKQNHGMDDFISSKMVKALYGDVLINSVSRVEAFAKCPFAHFVNYGLQLQERPEFSIKMPDVGIVFHKAIDRFAFKLDKVYHIGWESIDDQLRRKIVLESVQEVIEQEERGLFIHTARARYLVEKITRIVDRSIWAIIHQINSGKFRPVGHEFRFDSEDGIEALRFDFEGDKAMKIKGSVDRLDYYALEDTGYLTIVDYKSGHQSIDFIGLYYGLQLQLFVYMNACLELKTKTSHKTVQPAGVFYFQIDDPLIKTSEQVGYEVIEAKLKEQLKLDGVLLNNQDIIRALDQYATKESTVIPIKYNLDGSLRKSEKLLEPSEFDTLLKYTNHKVQALGQEILEGNVKVEPYKKGNEKNCDYCHYGGICMFDHQTHDYNDLEAIEKETIINLMKASIEK